MARWKRNTEIEGMPDRLASFRAADWLADVAAVTDPEVDVWTASRWYDRPRTDDEAVRAAYARFREARTEWEAAHPEWVRREIDKMIENRLERARRGIIDLNVEEAT
jgi:hypothetical protein